MGQSSQTTCYLDGHKHQHERAEALLGQRQQRLSNAPRRSLRGPPIGGPPGYDAMSSAAVAQRAEPHRNERIEAQLLHEARSDFRTELAICELGQRDPAVRDRVKQVDDRRMTFLCELFRELGLHPDLAQARSLMLYSLLIGNHFIAARHGRMSRARVLELSVDELLKHSR